MYFNQQPPGSQYPGGAPPPNNNAGYGPPGAGAPPGNFAPPGSGYPQTNGPPGYANPSMGTGGPPGSSYGAYGAGGIAPPPSGFAPPGAQGPPTSRGPPTMQGPPGAGPPGGMMPPMNVPPPSNFGGVPAFGGAPAQVQPPKSSVTFFSTAGGAPVPSVPTGGPPSQAFVPVAGAAVGGPSMPPPPSTLGAPMMAVPPSSMPGAGPQYGMNSMVGMPAGFDSGSNLAGGYQPVGVPGAPMGMGGDPALGSGTGAAGGAPLPSIDEMDLSVQCNPNFLRATVSKIVGNQGHANNSRIPLGLVCKPMWGDKGTQNDEIEVVDFGATGIVRCKRCRTYINPFVTWADNGRKWRCNICGMLNDVPSTYFSHLDNNGQRRDKDQRPELSRCSVEFVAPGDYMVRPPQPPVYFFVLDVSEATVASGVIQCFVNAIKKSLDDIPGSPRTQIGFITFDSHIHFYNLKSSLAAPQMLVVSDVSDIIMPSPEDLLVNLEESRAVVEALLDSLPSMFKTSSSAHSCTGPALMAAKRVIQHLGGKLLLFQSSLPSIGEGSLKIRENPRMLGTDKEHMMLNPEDPWYKTNAIDFSRLQVSVDTFLFSGQYTDVATLATLSKYTSGSTYYYPGFQAFRDGVKFEKDLCNDLTRATAFEAVMRVRATRGLRFANFYGNYFVRGTDLLALPNCTSDSSFTLDIAYDEAQLSAQAITIQSALLYTSSAGERRIRVHTMVLPVTASVQEMTETLDIDCAMNVLSKQAVDIAQKTGMDNARQRVNQTTVEIMRAAKAGPGGGGGMMGHQQYGMAAPQSSGNNPLPASLLLLPLYSMSLQKSVVIRGGTDVRVDERAYFQCLLMNMDIEESKVFIYPRMFSIHDMADNAGMPLEEVEGEEEIVPTAGPFHIRLPSILNLSYERLTSDGVFLLENGQDLFMWVGRAVDPNVVLALFGFQSLEGVDMNTIKIQPELSEFAERVNTVVEALRADRARHMQLHFIREGDGYAEAYFARFLIEDRANFSGGGLSYTEYHAHVTRAVSNIPG